MEQDGLIDATQMPMVHMAHDLYADKLSSKFPLTYNNMKHRMLFKLYSLATFGEIRLVNTICFWLTGNVQSLAIL